MTEETMLTKMADAIRRADLDGGGIGLWEVRLAKAALEAIKSPSEELKEFMTARGDYEAGAFSEAIDAILQERA